MYNDMFLDFEGSIQQVKWFQFLKKSAEANNILFKNSLDDLQQFQSISFSRRGRHVILEPPKCYSGPVQINNEKKKDLSILHI